MTYQTEVPGWQAILEVISGNTATVVVNATDQAWLVTRLVCAAHDAAATPSLTVDTYKVSTTTPFYHGAGGKTWNANPLTAKQSVEFGDILIPKGHQLRVTSNNASGLIHVTGLKALVAGA